MNFALEYQQEQQQQAFSNIVKQQYFKFDAYQQDFENSSIGFQNLRIAKNSKLQSAQYNSENCSSGSTTDSDNDSQKSSSPVKNGEFALENRSTSSSISSQGYHYNKQQIKKIQFPEGEKFQQNKKKQIQQNYKTELCRNYIQGGHCQYGKKCKYAHGSSELNQKQGVSEFYKTRECKLFHQDGYCSYGIRCHFQHVYKTLDDIQKSLKAGFVDHLKHGIIEEKQQSRFSFARGGEQQEEEQQEQEQQQQMQPQQYQEQYFNFDNNNLFNLLQQQQQC